MNEPHRPCLLALLTFALISRTAPVLGQEQRHHLTSGTGKPARPDVGPYIRRLLDAARLEPLDAKRMAAALGCSPGAARRVTPHRTECDLTSDALVTEGVVVTGDRGWIALSFKPASGLALTLADLEPALRGLPHRIAPLTGHSRGAPFIRATQHAFRMPAGALVLETPEAAGGPIQSVTITNEPAGLETSSQGEAPPAGTRPPEFPIAVEVGEALPGQPIRLVVRNTTAEAGQFQVQMPLQAFVLRDVRWSDRVAGARSWHHPLKGQSRVRKDGTVDHLLHGEGSTALRFEEGLLLPGHPLTVEVPRPAKGAPAHDLVVEYAVVAPGADFHRELLLPKPISPKSPGDSRRYVKASQAQLSTFRPGDPVLVRSTREATAPALAVRSKTFAGLLREPVH